MTAQGSVPLERAAHAAKAEFEHVYRQPDPRPYFAAMGALDYREVEHCARLVRALLPSARLRGDRPTVLDLGCSYGVLGVLLRTDITFEQLQAHYRDPVIRSLAADELAVADRAWIRSRLRPDRPAVIGIDAAPLAVHYASAIAAVDAGSVADLEHHAPSQHLAILIEQADLIAVSGAVGYVTAATFERLLGAAGDRPPWIAALVTRTYPYDCIMDTLASHGLVTERLAGTTFVRRRFANPTERARVLAALAARDLDPTGLEADGAYHSEFYLSRPTDEADPPIESLVAA